ncbi:MAG: GNAT family protein [Candidatus Bathyarchaeota archaeon]
MFVGKKVCIRSFELSDLDEIMKYWNKVELRRLLGSIDDGPASSTQEEEWIKETWKLRKEKKAFQFAITTLKDKKLIGGAGLFNFHWTSRSAEVGIGIYNPEYWGKGYGVESLNLVLGFAFQNLNLNRVELEVFDFNKRAYKCYRKVGFNEVGRKREALFMEGQYHDAIIMDILKDEWMKKQDIHNQG